MGFASLPMLYTPFFADDRGRRHSPSRRPTAAAGRTLPCQFPVSQAVLCVTHLVRTCSCNTTACILLSLELTEALAQLLLLPEFVSVMLIMSCHIPLTQVFEHLKCLRKGLQLQCMSSSSVVCLRMMLFACHMKAEQKMIPCRIICSFYMA